MFYDKSNAEELVDLIQISKRQQKSKADSRQIMFLLISTYKQIWAIKKFDNVKEKFGYLQSVCIFKPVT